jgi:hypothetical protein
MITGVIGIASVLVSLYLVFSEKLDRTIAALMGTAGRGARGALPTAVAGSDLRVGVQVVI